MYIQYFIILQLTTVQVIGKSVTIGTILEINNFTEINFISSIKEIISHYDSHHEKQINVIEISYRMPYDLLNIHSKACSLIESGVATIFGNLGKIASEYIQSICDVMEIPYITFSWEPYQERGKSINFYPHADSLAEFYYLLMKEMEWKSFALLYDSTDSLIRLNIVLRKQNANNFPILFQRIGKPTSNRHVFRQIRDSGEKNIVIDCSYDILENVLFQALQVGLLSDKYNIFITTMDFQAINFNLFQYSGANITGIRLIHTQSLSLLQNLRKNNELHFGIKNPKQMLTNEALIYDAINVFSEGFRKLKYVTKGDHKKLSCTNSENWEYGISLNNFIKSVEMKGLTGLITFDNAGFRTNFEIEIFKVTYDGIRDIGKYNSSRNIQWFSDNSVEVPRDKMSLRNITFRVLIALTKPYGMLRETVFKMTGNDQYEGFAIDVIHEISNMLGFNYTFSVQMDNVYGSLNPETGQWNGMLRKIIDNEADLAITDLTITAERENAVDFTMPFMNLGISILYQKPKAAPPSLMSFLLPFSAHVWLYLILVYIVVSILFFIIGRMCPAEWNNIYPCIEEPEELQNQFNIKNSFWFCIGAIMQQGADIAPIGNSTRMLAGSWYFFCLIMVSSYTANLAAFLTVETVERPIKNAEDLANQNIIQYGAKRGGSTLGFFKDSNSTTYSKMYQYMMNNEKEVLTADNDAGKKKVLNENYAFLMESSSIEYIQERECNLTQIGGLLDQKGYGIAMKKNQYFVNLTNAQIPIEMKEFADEGLKFNIIFQPANSYLCPMMNCCNTIEIHNNWLPLNLLWDASYRNELSRAVLKLQEMGILTALKSKWWKEKGGHCQEDSGGGQAEELGLANVGGVFLVLIVGVTLSFFGTIFEFFFSFVNIQQDKKVSLKDKLSREIMFIVNFGTSTKMIKDQQLK